MSYCFKSSDYEIICPYCQHGYFVEEDLGLENEFGEEINFWEDASHVVECPDCGKKFNLDIETKYSYNTSTIEPDQF